MTIDPKELVARLRKVYEIWQWSILRESADFIEQSLREPAPQADTEAYKSGRTFACISDMHDSCPLSGDCDCDCHKQAEPQAAKTHHFRCVLDLDHSGHCMADLFYDVGRSKVESQPAPASELGCGRCGYPISYTDGVIHCSNPSCDNTRVDVPQPAPASEEEAPRNICFKCHFGKHKDCHDEWCMCDHTIKVGDRVLVTTYHNSPQATVLHIYSGGRLLHDFSDDRPPLAKVEFRDAGTNVRVNYVPVDELKRVPE